MKEQKAIIDHPNYQLISPMELEIQEFVRFIKSGSQPKTNLDQAINVTKIIAAAEKSLATGKKAILLPSVEVPLR